MEILDSSESFLHWDRNLSELSEAGDNDCVLYSNVSYRSVMRYQREMCVRVID